MLRSQFREDVNAARSCLGRRVTPTRRGRAFGRELRKKVDWRDGWPKKFLHRGQLADGGEIPTLRAIGPALRGLTEGKRVGLGAQPIGQDGVGVIDVEPANCNSVNEHPLEGRLASDV